MTTLAELVGVADSAGVTHDGSGDGVLTLERNRGGSVSSQVNDRIHVGFDAAGGYHRAFVATGIMEGLENGGADVAHVLDRADLKLISGLGSAVVHSVLEPGQGADVVLKVGVNQADITGANRNGAVVRGASGLLGDVGGVLALEGAGDAALVGQ